MKTKLKIVHANGEYIGYVLENGEVKAQTPPCKDPATTSKLLKDLAESPRSSPWMTRDIITTSKKYEAPSPAPISNMQHTQNVQVRKGCCGRG